MKLSLVTSIFLNLVLAGVLASLLVTRHHEKTALAPTAQSETAPVVARLLPHVLPSANTETAFTEKGQQLEVTDNATERFSPERAKQVVAGLVGEPKAEAATLIPTNDQEPETQMFSAQQSPMAGVRVATQNAVTVASYPVTMQEPVSSDPALSANQKAAVQQIQQQFENAVGGPNQNPSDPAYAARWQTAQTDADDALLAVLGSQAYQSYQLQHYFSNFQKVMLGAGNSAVTINPTTLAK